MKIEEMGKRLEDLEEICYTQKGIIKTFGEFIAQNREAIIKLNQRVDELQECERRRTEKQLTGKNFMEKYGVPVSTTEETAREVEPCFGAAWVNKFNADAGCDGDGNWNGLSAFRGGEG